MDKAQFDKRKYDMQYAKENLQQIKFVLNKETDADILAWLNQQPNKAGYLKELIRRDMAQKKA
ncbi:MAG: hypothetical protein J6T99_00940 [Oscillospiraceae bacterium]|nr:hypothetical protein [Lentisphaeria bacterium]MBO7421938.1 hypothetical protein [Oscillospiraceae bacterium]